MVLFSYGKTGKDGWSLLPVSYTIEMITAVPVSDYLYGQPVETGLLGLPVGRESPRELWKAVGGHYLRLLVKVSSGVCEPKDSNRLGQQPIP